MSKRSRSLAQQSRDKPTSMGWLLLFAVSGCSAFLAPGVSTSTDEDEDNRPTTNGRIERERQRAAQQAAREEERRQRAAEIEMRERAIWDDVTRLRDEIIKTNDVVQLAKPFAERVVEASRTERARKGTVEMARLYTDAAHYLEKAILQKPSLELFDVLAGLPPGEDTDPSVVAVCSRVRPLVPAEEVSAFVGTCLDSAGGDEKKLVWPNSRMEVALHLEEEKVRALEATIVAEKARAVQAKVDRYVAAAVFASGRCRFGNCLKDGWTKRIADGDVDVSCSFSNCFKDGWTARFPDGSQAQTRCSFSDCAKDGWTTTFPDGSQATTRCSFSNCLKDGWSTDLPNGETITTRCSFSDCSTQGWETQLPSGQTIHCRCNFGKCLQDGATCE